MLRYSIRPGAPGSHIRAAARDDHVTALDDPNGNSRHFSKRHRPMQASIELRRRHLRGLSAENIESSKTATESLFTLCMPMFRDGTSMDRRTRPRSFVRRPSYFPRLLPKRLPIQLESQSLSRRRSNPLRERPAGRNRPARCHRLKVCRCARPSARARAQIGDPVDSRPHRRRRQRPSRCSPEPRPARSHRAPGAPTDSAGEAVNRRPS